MNYKFLLASLLPFAAFGMEKETKKSEIKIAQIAPTQEQKNWLAALYSAIENHTVACIGENFTNSNKETCLSQIKELITKLAAQDAINYTFNYTNDPNWNFPLNYACHYGNKEIVKLLINAGADVNLCNPFSLMAPLHKAASHYDRKSIVKLFINKGADINTQNNYLEIPLHRASSDKIVTLLLEAGSPLETLNKDNLTPLLCLIFRTKHETLPLSYQHLVDAASALLSYGANIYAKDKSGKTAYQILKEADLEPEQLIKEGQAKYFLRLSLQKLPNDWLKFAQAAHSIQSQIINISNQQFNIHPAITSTRCPKLNLLT